jgi:hypothetical protein
MGAHLDIGRGITGVPILIQPASLAGAGGPSGQLKVDIGVPVDERPADVIRVGAGRIYALRRQLDAPAMQDWLSLRPLVVYPCGGMDREQRD